MPVALEAFSSIWIIVIVVEQQPGEQVKPITIAAMDLVNLSVVQLGVPKLLGVRVPPYPTGPQSLILTIDAHLLAGFHIALGWRQPDRLIDLLVEHRNDLPLTRAMVAGLPGAMIAAGLSAAPVLVGGTTPQHMLRRLNALARLFEQVRHRLDLGRALLRGRYLCAVARMEATGVPIDGDTVARLRDDWLRRLDCVIATVDREFDIYRGRHVDAQAFAAMVARYQIDWPRGANGALDLDDTTFAEMARLHPFIRPLKELRATVFGFDPRALTIGRDSRNRLPLRPFSSITGRNQPSAKASVLGSASWVRHLIRPTPGTGLAMIDWQQQEFGIAAALSNDDAMQAAYMSSDPYMALAIAARAAPANSTASSDSAVRERFKRCALGLQYGIGRARLARQLGLSEGVAASLIGSHRTAFPKFWTWADAVEMRSLIDRELRSVFGWRLPVDNATNPRSIRNFPMQANGSEMLRLACCLMTEAGIRVCAPNHDAIMIEAPLNSFEETVVEAQRMMKEASEIVLGGFALRTSVRTVKAPDHWSEPRGQTIWSAVKAALAELPCSRA